MIERANSLLSFDKPPLLVFQVALAAFGGGDRLARLLFGQVHEGFPFWLCAVVSSALFAAGHSAVGNFGLFFYDMVTIFIDRILYALIFKKAGNCLIRTVSHILCNAARIAATVIWV